MKAEEMREIAVEVCIFVQNVHALEIIGRTSKPGKWQKTRLRVPAEGGEGRNLAKNKASGLKMNSKKG